jgi:type I restriction enzyme, S subunit
VKLPVYANYTSGGTASLAHVPQDWEVKRLKFVLKEPLKYGANESADDDDRELPRYVRITDVDERGNLRDETFRSLPIEVAKHYLLQEGDILFARSGATAGKTFLYDSSWGVCAYAGYLIRARIDTHKASSRFLRYFTDSATYWGWISANFIQATIQNVSAEKYANLPIALPPVGDQRAIADFLDRETARLDTLLGKKRELIERLEEKRTALISRTVTRGLNPNAKLKPSGIEWLGDIPAHWEVKKLSWLFRYCKGPNAATLTKEYVASNTGDFPVFSGQTEGEGLMGMIDDYEFDFAARVIFITTVGARAMTTRLVSGKFSLSQNCALIVPRMADLSVAYYNGVLRRLFDFERRSISLIMQPSLRFEDLHKFRVPRPPAPEQRAIADYLDGETAKLDRMMEKVEAAIEKLQEYRTALITAAVTGKIDVRKNKV